MAVNNTWRPIQNVAADKDWWEWATNEQLGPEKGGTNYWNTLTNGQEVSGSPGWEWAQNNGVWGTQPRDPNAPATGNLGFTPTNAPAFNAPTRTAPGVAMPTLGTVDPYAGPGAQPTFGNVDPYSGPGAFTAPTADQMTIDPGYKFRLDESLKAANATAAANGILRGGNQVQANLDRASNMASQEYAALFGRSKDIYDRNYDAAGDAYNRSRDERDARFNAATGQWDRAYRVGSDTYDRNRLERDARYAAGVGDYNRDADERNADYTARLEGAKLEYDPRLQTWVAQNAASNNNAEQNFNRDWAKYTYAQDMDYNRWGKTLDENYRRDTYAGDDAWRRFLSDRQNLQFLASLGNE